MPRSCGPCGDKRRNELDRCLLEMEISRETYRTISQEFGYSEDALRRHKANHLALDLVAAREAMEQAREEAKAAEFQAARAKVIEEISIVAADSMAARMENATGYLAQLREVRRSAADLLDKADASDDLRAAAAFLKELREQIRLLAEMEGKLASQPQIHLNQMNVYQSPAWSKVGEILAKNLAGYPGLRSQIAGELLKLAKEGP